MNDETKQVTGEDLNDYCAHFGLEVQFDMIADLDVEDQLISEFEIAFQEAFKNWKAKAEEKGAVITNVQWD